MFVRLSVIYVRRPISIMFCVSYEPMRDLWRPIIITSDLYDTRSHRRSFGKCKI